MFPSLSDANVWASLVKNAVTASVPSEPAVPPSTLNTFIESVKPSLVAEIVTGNLSLSEPKPPELVAAENDKLPLTIPLKLESTSLLSKLKLVMFVPSAPVIVISPLPIVALFKFC